MAIAEVQRRDQLLRAAARLFSRHGYHGTSMQDVAEEVGILRGSLYAHIDSKEDILFAIVAEGAARFLEGMAKVIASDAPADQKVRAAIRFHMKTVAEHIESATVFLNDWKFLSETRRSSIEEHRDRYAAMVGAIIEEGVRDSTLREDLDTGLTVLLILSAANWMYQWYDPDGPSAPEELADAFGEMILSGISKKRRAN